MMKWISVHERMPESSRSCLVWDDGCVVAFFDLDAGTCHVVHEGYIDPTHWMELPGEPTE